MANNYEFDTTVIVGKVVDHVVINNDNDVLELHFTDGTDCQFYHSQECCESVTIQSHNKLELLNGATITKFKSKEVTGTKGNNYTTTTTQTFTTTNGVVKVVWLGESNGYYSETVHFEYNDN